MEVEFHQLELRYEALRIHSAERERRLLASLAQVGQQTPVVVVKAEEPARYVVIDGYKRIRGLKRLGQDTVRAVCWDVDEAEGLVLEHQMQSSGKDSALEQGWLLRELHERFGLSLVELARRFDRSTSWASRRLSLVKQLPEPIQERVRRGEIVAHAAMKYLVPLARANLGDCLRLLEAIQPRRLTTREMGKLYSAYVSGDDRTRELVVSQPLLFLRVEEEAHRTPEPETRPSEALFSDLNLLAAVSRRALRRLRAGLGKNLVAPERERTYWLWRQAQSDFEGLSTLCDKEFTDAGRSDTKRHPQAQGQGLPDSPDCPSPGSLPGSGPQSVDPRQCLRPSLRAGGESRALSGADPRPLRSL